MAPLDENTYSRARVVKKCALEGKLLVYVHFIDEGHGAWMQEVIDLA